MGACGAGYYICAAEVLPFGATPLISLPLPQHDEETIDFTRRSKTIGKWNPTAAIERRR